MRLKLAVQRHNLPPVRLLFNVETSHVPGKPHISTIADLITAIDDVVPLESENGYWGLEDYTLEVNGYECFHYQDTDVLREGDEVLVRALSSIELRERRYGGRIQITGDGRHLVDGACWGKRKRPGDRPHVNIPPRKKARLFQYEDEYEDEDEEERLALPGIPENEQRSLIAFGEGLDEEDEEDDEDWNGADDYGEENESEDLSSDEDEDEDEDEDVDQDEQLEEPERELDSQELLSTIAEAEPAIIQTPPRKRRLTRSSMQSTEQENGDFDGVSPAKVSTQILVLNTPTASSPAQTQSQENEQSNSEFNGFSSPAKVSSQLENSNYTEHPSVTLSDIRPTNDADSSDSSDEEGIVPATNEPIPADDHSDSSSSSDDSSDSESDDDFSSSNSDSDSDDTSSDESESDSDDSTSSPNTDATTISNSEPAKLVTTPQSLPAVPKPIDTSAKSVVAPGQGMSRTHKNNERKKRNKLMRRLKEEGKLGQEANFEDLRLWLAENDPTTNTTVESHNDESAQNVALADPSLPPAKPEIVPTEVSKDQIQSDNRSDYEDSEDQQLTARRKALLEQLDQAPTTQSESASDENIVLETTEQQGLMETTEKIELSKPANSMPPTPNDQQTEEPSPKRARLDVAGSRRLVFGALGVRNPKTPAAEQAVREKLAGPSRTPINASDKQSITSSDTVADDRWKKKLTISAFECVNDYKNIEFPSFPFQHPWEIRQSKGKHVNNRRKSRKSEYEPEQEPLIEQNDREIDDVESATASRTITTGPITQVDESTAPEIENFQTLTDLEQNDAVEGAYIAYRQLDLNENFEPEESPYRAGWIMSNINGQLEVLLAAQYRKNPEPQFDEDTGERVYAKFEMPDDDVVDDGMREISFDQLIQPKLVSVAPGRIMVPNSNEIPPPPSGQPLPSLDGSQIKITETPPIIDTPRRQQIDGMIKDAGFESALDEQSINPLPETTASQKPFHSASAIQPLDETDIDMNHQWRSSPRETSPIQPSSISLPRESSAVPSESMVESVRYPTLSQLELATPQAALSSSHQDAQRISPLLNAETSLLDSALGHLSEQVESQPIDSLPSIISKTEPGRNESVEYTQSDTHEPAGLDEPFGFEGASSPTRKYQSESESQDSNGLPSLRSVSSSQRLKSEESSQPRRSPRPTRTTAKTTDWSDSEKYSQSQKSQKPASQTLPADEIIDLTQTSTENLPEKPIKSRTRSGSSQGAAFRKSFEGLGQKTVLKRKKKSL